MAVITYPLNASGGAPLYNARMLRQALAALMMPGAGPLRTRTGFRPGGQPTVSVTATTWTVGPFSAVIDTGQATVTGPYLVDSDANEVGSVTAAHASFDRKDILYTQVDDTDESDGSGQRRSRVLYLAGTASATPSAPATPARSLLVGTVDVPKVGGGSPAFTPSNMFTAAAGGVLPMDATNLLPGSWRYPGQLFSRTDLGQLQFWTGSSARVVFDEKYPSINNTDFVLAERWYGVGVAYAVRSNATNTRADVDAAMTLTFVAPDTGAVWIELEGMAAALGVTAGTGNFGTYWCLRDVANGSLVTDSALPVLPFVDTQATRLRYSTRVSGLTPGQSYTYAWQHYRGTGATGTAYWYIGGGIKALMRAKRAL